MSPRKAAGIFGNSALQQAGNAGGGLHALDRGSGGEEDEREKVHGAALCRAGRWKASAGGHSKTRTNLRGSRFLRRQRAEAVIRQTESALRRRPLRLIPERCQR